MLLESQPWHLGSHGTQTSIMGKRPVFDLSTQPDHLIQETLSLFILRHPTFSFTPVLITTA